MRVALLWLMFVSPLYAITNGVKVADNAPLAQAIPFLVSGKQACSGTLIAPRVVLTAAHCIMKDQRQIAFFYTDKRERVAISAQKTVIHPDYRVPKQGESKLAIDLALIYLSRPAPTSPIAVIGGAVTKSEVTIAGRGKKTYDEKQTSGDAYSVRLPVLAVNETHLVISNQSAGACPGDSGGPLLIGGGLAGVLILSSGQNKKGCGYMTAALKIDKYIPWMNEQIIIFNKK